MSEVSVSVIMGVYNMNDASMLYEAINSILNQTFNDFEFIICDDGSVDGTYELLNNLSLTDSRIVLIRNESNLGLAATLNKCIQLSRGKYIARMDADDISAPERLEEEYNFLTLNNQYVLVGCNSFLFDGKGVYGERTYEEFPVRKSFLINSPFIHPTIMISKEAITAIHGYRVSRETKRTEDYDMFMRLYFNNYLGYNIQKCLYYYREDKKSFIKRKYRYRIDESIVRYKGFRDLKLFPIGFLYIIKPLIVGGVPHKILNKLKKNTKYY